MFRAPVRLIALTLVGLGLTSVARAEPLPPIMVKQDAVVFKDPRSLAELGMVKPGQVYTRLRSEGTRSAIRWNGEQLGWLEEQTLHPLKAKVWLAAEQGALKVLAQPAVGAAALGTLPLGASFVPLETKGDFMRLSFAGQDGWVEKNKCAGPISELSPDAAPSIQPTSLPAGMSDPLTGNNNGTGPGAGGANPGTGGGNQPFAGQPAANQASEPFQGGTQRGAVSANESELEVMARIIKGEALQCSHEGKVAVGAVILNRVRSPKFPNSIIAVCHQPLQFSCYNRQFRARLYEGPIPPECLQAARDALAGQDPVNGADHYYNPYLVQPSWARNMVLVRRIGTNRTNTHDFFRSR